MLVEGAENLKVLCAISISSQLLAEDRLQTRRAICFCSAPFPTTQTKQSKQHLTQKLVVFTRFQKQQLHISQTQDVNQPHILYFKYVHRASEEDLSRFQLQRDDTRGDSFIYSFTSVLFQRHICADGAAPPSLPSPTLLTTCDNSQLKAQRFVLFSWITDHFLRVLTSCCWQTTETERWIVFSTSVDCPIKKQEAWRRRRKSQPTKK